MLPNHTDCKRNSHSAAPAGQYVKINNLLNECSYCESDKNHICPNSNRDTWDTLGQVRDSENNEILQWFEGDLLFSVRHAAQLAGTYLKRLRRDKRLKTTKIAGKTRIYACSLFKHYPQAEINYLSEQAKQTQPPLAVIPANTGILARTPIGSDPDAPTADDARKYYVLEFISYLSDSGKSVRAALMVYCEGLSGSFTPDWVLGLLPAINANTLKTWYYAYLKKGAGALEYKYKGNPGTWFDKRPKETEWLEGLLLLKPHLKASLALKAFKAHFPNLEPPCEKSFYRWIKRYKADHAAEFLLNANPEKARGKYKASFGSYSEKIIRPNQRWEIDSTPVDIIFADKDRRCMLIGVTDVYTDRRIFSVVERESSRAIGQLLFRAICEWGVPEQVVTDNGKPYIAVYLTRFFADCGVNHKRCNPGSGWEKPHVERAFRTLQHDIPELCLGFCGHNVTEAQAIRASLKRLSPACKSKEQTLITAAITEEGFKEFLLKYEKIDLHRPRKGGRLKGKRPIDIINDYAKTHTIRRFEDVDTLVYLLQPGDTRTVSKEGILYKNFTYGAAKLGELIGEVVEVRESAESAGRLAVFSETGEFICIAVEPDLEGISRAEIAAKMKAAQNAANADIRSYQRKRKKLVNEKETINEILDDQLKGASNVTVFQRPEYQETLETSEARKALEAEKALARAKHTEPTLTPEQRASIEATLQTKKADDPLRRFARLIRQTEPLTQEEAAFVEHFKQLPEGRAIARLTGKVNNRAV